MNEGIRYNIVVLCIYSCKQGCTCRLLALAAQFSTRLVRRHGMTGARRNCTDDPTASPLSNHDEVKLRSRTGVTELARFLEVIRTLQEHLQEKRKGRNRTFKVSKYSFDSLCCW